MICLQVVNFSHTAKYPTPAIRMLQRELQSISRLATHADRFLFISLLLQVTSSNSTAHILSNFLVSNNLSRWTHFSLWILHPQNRTFFCVDCSSEECSPIGNNIQEVLNSTELSGAMERETIIVSSVASPEPRIVTIDSESNELTMPYGFGSQHPIVPSSLKDLNLPPNHINVLATRAVIRADAEYCPQSPEPSIPSPIS